MQNYADVLESYLIPAEEGINDALAFCTGLRDSAKDVWRGYSPAMKVVAGSSIALTVAGTIAHILKKRKPQESAKTSKYNTLPRLSVMPSIIEPTNNPSDDLLRERVNAYKAEELLKDKKHQEYVENTRAVIAKMQEDCPDIIKAEMELRRSELKAIRTVLTKFSKTIKTGGFLLFLNELDQFIKYDPDDDYFGFLEELLCPYSEKLFDGYDDGYEWAIKSEFTIDVVGCNIYEWNDTEMGGNAQVRTDDAKPYWDTINKIVEDLTDALSRFKCVSGVAYGGDWDGGGIFIAMKPSGKFVTIAKRYGYYE